jgi:hypothetical protein
VSHDENNITHRFESCTLAVRSLDDSLSLFIDRIEDSEIVMAEEQAQALAGVINTGLLAIDAYKNLLHAVLTKMEQLRSLEERTARGWVCH